MARRAADNWGQGAFFGVADRRKRASGLQGRPPARPKIGEVAYEWFIDMREKNRARVTPDMVAAKVAAGSGRDRRRRAKWRLSTTTRDARTSSK